MSKLFTEFSVQQNTCPFPKIPAKNSNVFWLSLGCDNMLPQTVWFPFLSSECPHCTGTTAQHLSTDTSRPVPCTRWPRRLLRDRAVAMGATGCLAGVTACPELRQAQAPLLLRLLPIQRLPEGNGLQEATARTSAAESNISNTGGGRGGNISRII